MLLFGNLEAREWKNAQGRAFEAEWVSTEGTNIVFKMINGRRFQMPLLDLSAADQVIIKRGTDAPLENIRLNFGRPWPASVRPNGNPACIVISEDAEKHHYIYQSPGYQFHSDARITHDALANFATVFESTRAFLAALPLSLMSNESLGKHSRVLLFGNEATYYKSGGPENSAGCFLPLHRLVLVPMSSLGLVKGGTGFSRDVARENTILVHELVHQLTPNAYYVTGAKGWFSEGLAEYVAATPYFSGTFKPDPYGNAVKEYVTAFGPDGKGGRGLGTDIAAPKLRNFLLMNYRDFSGADGNRNYGISLLVTHYFFHMEGGGNAKRISSFLKELHRGEAGEEALAPLLGGGSFEKLETEISDAWDRKGVKIHFGS